MAKQYWLIKSEPTVYSFERLLKEKKTRWDGIRSFEARNNLRLMKAGDALLFYHSNVGKAVVGVATVVKEAYPDPSAKGEDWSAIDVAPVKPLTAPVTLADLKAHAMLSAMEVVKKSRLSVTKVTADEFKSVLAAGQTKL